ncbi:MAG: Mut7-C RNAse domain-containing protein [Deltaproteobacteria bacterium]
MSEYEALFKLHDELQDFLPASVKGATVHYEFDGRPSIKDSIEAIGVPHTEVDLVTVNGKSVGFGYHLKDGDEVFVYPVSSHVKISPRVKLRDKPAPVFIADVNLGKLARLLRMAGFDTVFRNDYDDHEVARLGCGENRIVLTRDRRLLRHRIIAHGYWVRSPDPGKQLIEVLGRFDLWSDVAPFNRCLDCNGVIEPVPKQDILERLEPGTILYYDEFFRCSDCRKIYWKGSHYDHMNSVLENLRNS